MTNLPIIDKKIEKKLGKRVLAAIADMGATPRDNMERFTIVQRNLARAVAEYTKYTRSDGLLYHPSHYGYHV